ncbi:ubinuclein-2-like isoform X2 [Acipenser ruthenus]|uniref:ubinuclein-2-like isoform X2 n=1 Tax=Acipenser ruthenus TaxID=7906 RepID=UPI002741A8A0|nr:ubinuclein-2-like isoform X2 [Acipenser ruthenus]
MAEPRKVAFITLSPPDSHKRCREDEPCSPAAPMASGNNIFPGTGTAAAAAAADGEKAAERRITVRLNLRLSEPSEQASAEFNYSELVQSIQVKKPAVAVAPVPTNPDDPFDDDERERLQLEAMARKFESKYGNTNKKKRRDRVQDLIDIGFGYDETDPFIDNSEAYDELVPASLTTKFGGFYINAGTLQFRPASDSEGDDTRGENKMKPHRKLKEGEERGMKKRKRKEEGSSMEKEKKPRKNRVPKTLGVSALNAHRPDKKKRKKLMKDSLSLAAMLRKFTREKESMKRSAPPTQTPAGLPKPLKPSVSTHSPALHDLPDPSVLSLLGSANDSELFQQAASAMELLGDIDLEGLLESTPQDSPEGGASSCGQENGMLGAVVAAGGGGAARTQVMRLTPPPPLPDGLPASLRRRIGDLREASRQFDEEGRKKFFTLDMNNILLDIELQVQEQPPHVRAAVYCHLEAFVPCNKDMLLKRVRKLNLNVQDDRLRAPLLKLKLAVSNVMPEQLSRYRDDCLAHNQAKVAKVAKLHSEEDRERNGSEDEDDEKPGKRVMGPRKKFHWDENIRALLCNLVQIKLGCYELEPNKTMTAEDYLKSFLESEVKPLWPKGWMQARMLFKESRSVHSRVTGNSVKKKIVPTPKTKIRDSSPKDGRSLPSLSVLGGVSPRTPASAVGTPAPQPAPPGPSTSTPLPPPRYETICLDDSLDEDLSPSLDSISEALALLSNAARGLVSNASPPPLSSSSPSSSPSSSSSSREDKSAMGPPSKPATALPPRPSPKPNPSPKLNPNPSPNLNPKLNILAGLSAPLQNLKPRSSLAPPSGQPGKQQPHSPALKHSLSAAAPPVSPVVKLHSSPGSPSLLSHGSKHGGQAGKQQRSHCSPAPHAKLQAAPPASQPQKLHPAHSHSLNLQASPSPPVSGKLQLLSSRSLQQPKSSVPSRPLPSGVLQTPSFVSSMQATLSKSPLNPIVKLSNALPSPGPPRASPAPSSSSSSSAVNINNVAPERATPPRSSPSPSPSLPVQARAVSSSSSLPPGSYKTPAGGPGGAFRPPYTSSGPSSAYSPSLQIRAHSGPSLTSPSSTVRGGTPVSQSAGASPSPAPSPASASSAANQRRSCPSPATPQRAGLAGSKPVTSRAASTVMTSSTVLQPAAVTQVTSGAGVLGSSPPLSLMTSPLAVSNPAGSLGPFGMLGGLVPVSLPFQFPLELLSFNPSDSSGSTSFPHNANQSQGNDVKRKSH